MSFKQKIRYSLKNDIKIAFESFNDDQSDVTKWITMIDCVMENNGHIIVQLPITNLLINERIQNLSDHQDIDNLRSVQWKYWCTQAAIVGLTKIVMDKFNIKSIAIIWSSWFIWKWVFEKLTNDLPSITIFWLDKNSGYSQHEEESILSWVDLIISTASSIINIPYKTKDWLCIIDCWLIRWQLWIRWSVPINKWSIEKYKFMTPVPQWIWPLEMLYMVSRIKWLDDIDIDKLLEKNIVASSL